MPARILIDVVEAAHEAAEALVAQIVECEPLSIEEVAKQSRESWKDDSEALSVELDVPEEELERYKTRYVSEYIREYERLLEDYGVCEQCGTVWHLDNMYIFGYERYCRDCYLSIFEYRAYIAKEPVELTEDEKKRYIMRYSAPVVKRFYTPWTLYKHLKAYDVNRTLDDDSYFGSDLLIFEKRDELCKIHEEYVVKNNPWDYDVNMYVDTFIRKW